MTSRSRRHLRARLPTLAFGLTTVVALVGCGGDAEEIELEADSMNADDHAGGEEPLTPIILGAPPILAEGTRELIAACHEDADEPCNALDDDCDGAIDEGCGYETGPVQITVAWNTDADLDLYVRDPAEELLSHQRSSVATGGVLDHSGRGGCDASMPHHRIENAFWPGPDVPRGSYTVILRYWGECVSAAGPTTATVSVRVGDSVMGTFVYTLVPNDRVALVEMEIP